MSDPADISFENSEHEESFETQDDSAVRSDNERYESSAEKSGMETSKPKRRGRRGKKRKQRKDSSAACESETAEAGETNEWNSEEDLDYKVGGLVDSVMVRPINVPKAPENYNTFIMDEHDECHLYMSFETPNTYEELRDQNVTGTYEDAAYMDIDYQYEPIYDHYYNKDFEESYKNNRFDQLVRLSRQDLIEGIALLEDKLRALSDELVKENPSPVLEKLQADLLELQEKNLELKECQSKLKQLIMDSSDRGSAPGESPANSQTLTDGFSPQSDLVSPSHTIESKLELALSEQSPYKIWSPTNESKHELALSEQSPYKIWSPYSPIHTIELKHELALSEQSPRKIWSPYDLEYDLELSENLKVYSSDMNANTKTAVSPKDGECCVSVATDLKVEELNISSEESSLRQNSECETDLTTLKNNLESSPREVPDGTSSTLEESNSAV